MERVWITINILIPFIRHKDGKENKNRQNILKFIDYNPGCILSGLVKKMKINRETARYHVNLLEQQGKIILKKIGKHLRLFPRASALSDKEKLLASYLNDELNKEIISTLLEYPGITNRDLSDRFSIDNNTIYYHLQQFISSKIVTYQKDGKRKRYFISDEYREALVTFMFKKR